MEKQMEKYRVVLDDKQRDRLQKITKSGTSKARAIKHAMILLKSSDGLDYDTIKEQIDVSDRMITDTKKRFAEKGLDACLREKPRPGRPKIVTPDVEAKITALACEDPPEGRSHVSIEIIKGRLDGRFTIALGWGTIQRTLAKNELKPWKKRCGASQS
jgi:putative transposase